MTYADFLVWKFVFFVVAAFIYGFVKAWKRH
ncbi:hypothetical protein GGD71_006840 [Variovorax guangxiensis]|uniref:Uncharacterized protein n=1 Tax=Variovorax guangxiensis TaxID=1775474 RepID=A0A840G437_9BURK|nr:hypothetical protein [Variovorax guangxiensis]